MKRADTNLRGVWYTILLIGVVATAVFLRLNTHDTNCHQTTDGYVCDVAWGASK